MNTIARQQSSPSDWMGVLRQRAEQTPERIAFRILGEGTAEPTLTDAELLIVAEVIAARLIERGILPGDRVLILSPPGLTFIAALFGTMAAGAVAVPTYPPRFAGGAQRLLPVLKTAEPKIVIASSEVIGNLLGPASPSRPQESDAWAGIEKWALTNEDVLAAAQGNERFSQTRSHALAVLQFTSGSTSSPKGVCLTHENLITNAGLIGEVVSAYSKGVSWLPPYHDMGLIGSLFTPLLAEIELNLMSPDYFLRRPIRWLEAMSRFGAEVSGGPDFAYSLCVRRITEKQKEGLDLSSWQTAFNGAERVRKTTIDRFCEAFAPCGFDPQAFAPCYGLAESTLCVSAPRGKRPLKTMTVKQASLALGRIEFAGESEESGGLQLVGCGPPLPGQELRLVDPETSKICGPGQVGEIWLSGKCVGDGYFRRPEASAAVFDARLDGDQRKYLRSGDLGALIDGELYITGRLKELIVVAGRNYYPEDIEAAVEQADSAFRSGSGVAFSVDDGQGESIALVHEISRSELKDPERAVRAAKDAVLQRFDLHLSAVLFVAKGKILRTTSGKLQRNRLREQFASGELQALFDSRTLVLEELSAPPSNDTQWRLARLIGEVLELPTIEPDEDFFSLGVQSIMATQLVAKIRDEFGVELPLRVIFEQPTLAQLAAGIARLEQTLDVGPRGPAPEGSHLELTASQERMWFLHQLDPLGSAYNVAGALRLSGTVRLDWIKNAAAHVWARHDILRSVYRNGDRGPEMSITPPDRVEVVVFGLEGRALNEDEVAELGTRMARAPFDLQRGPLSRIEAYVLAKDEGEAKSSDVTECTIAVCLHHIIADGWSVNVVMREIVECYLAQSENREPRLAPMTLQYSDYAYWHRRSLESGVLEPQVAYWKPQLQGLPELTELPSDFSRPPLHHQGGALVQRYFSEALTRTITEFASKKRVTPFMLLLAAFQILIRNYTRTTDIVVGTPIANRRFRAAEGLVGTLVNTLVLRSELSENATFSDHLAQVKEMCVAAFAHQDLPFERLVEEMKVPRHADRTPLFQIMFDHQVFEIPETEVAKIRILAEPLEKNATQVDFGVSIILVGGRFLVAAGYRSDLFLRSTIERLCANYERLVSAALSMESTKLSDLPWVNAGELLSIEALNRGSAQVVDPETTLESILARMQADPERVAVRCQGSELSYGRLGEQSARLATLLLAQGVGAGDRVGVCLNRSLDLVVALLAIWQTGASYVPIDPSYPAERIRMMTEDAPLTALLGHKEYESLWQGLDCPVVLMDVKDAPWSTGAQDGSAPQSPSARQVSGDGLAYVIFTSGSTGRPKGVQVTHRNVANFIQSMTRSLAITAEDRVIAVTTVAFDISVLEIFLPLASGAMVDIIPRDVSVDSLKLQARLLETKPTLMQATPATWRLLLDGGWKGIPDLQILCGGEALPAELAEHLIPRCLKLWNVYGPTETTVWSTMGQVLDAAAPITIGQPIANTQCHVLDEQRRPVPFGVVGELYIAGAGVTAGYVGRSDLTAERFVPNLFLRSSDRAASALMYRTGDLVRQRADGEILFVGRGDTQVKVRGYRIELGEIETQLAAYPGIERCIVELRHFGPSDARLVAYWTGERGHDPMKMASSLMRNALRNSLPRYMIPAHFVQLAELPLTPNGKVDRRALPLPEVEATSVRVCVDMSPTMELVADAWAGVLGVRPGAEDDFFESGGHSLLVVQLLGEIARRSGVRLPVNALFSATTVRALGELVDNGRERLEKVVHPLAPNLASLSSRAPSVFWVHTDPTLFNKTEGVMARLRRSLGTVWGGEVKEFALFAEGESFAHLPSLAGEYVGALAVHLAGRGKLEEGAKVGPSLFVGVGYGGNVALEVASQLLELGVENTRLLLLDTAFPTISAPRRFWKSNVGALSEGKLPLGYRDLSEVERTAWLNHQPEKYSQRVITATSANFRSERAQSDSLGQFLKREEVQSPDGSLTEISEKILTNLRDKLR